MARAGDRGEGALELLDDLPLGELAALEHRHDGPLLVVADRWPRERDRCCDDPGGHGRGSSSPRPQAGQRMRPPSAGASRWPQRQAQPIWRAGTPATIAWGGTSFVTTAPAATSAQAPTLTPATRIAPAPIAAPWPTSTRPSVQSSAPSGPPSGLTARGLWSLVMIAAGPMKTPSARLAPW